jgi:Na+-transporting NADH:ubiquinone oxidoreductase subunit C
MRHNVLYTLLFAAGVCLVCSILVSGSAVSLKDLQDINKAKFRQQNVLQAAGLLGAGEKISDDELAKRFATIEAVVVDLTTHQELPDVDPTTVDQKKMTTDPRNSRAVDKNPAQVQRVANQAVVYKKFDAAGELKMVILPVEGKGLWSTLYGFIALSSDFRTIEGLTFYEHKETPGLGGEVDNPSWKAHWPGRKAYDENWDPKIEVIKGQAGPPEEAPYKVDGMSGATITSRGVTYLIHFWLGETGFGPYLKALSTEVGERSAA